RRGSRSAGSPRAEHFLELERGRDVELIVPAVLRSLVRAPPQKDRRVPEAIALHVIVFDLAYALDPDRFPRQIFSRAPPALPTRQPRGDVFHGTGPIVPRMSFECVLAERLHLR